MYPNPANGQTVATLGANDPGTIYAGGQATNLPNKAAFYTAAAGSSLPISQYYNNPYGVSAAELDGLRGGGGGSTTGGGGGGGGGVAVDPYARYGGTAAYNNLLAGYKQQDQNIHNYEGDQINNAGVGLNQGILDLIQNSQLGQAKVDNQATQNYLAKQQGVRGINEMISQGLQSGGVQLANKNASNSSAGDALARAYSMLGRSQLAGVNGQFAQGQNAVNLAQQTQDASLSQGIRHQQDAKTMAINNIVADANQKLAYLDSIMNSASIPDRFNIAQEQQQIKDQAIGSLQQYDSQLSNGTANIKASSEDARSQSARDLLAKGTAPDTSFQYSNIAPGQFQGTGPFASQLPIFTIPSSKKTV